MTSAATERTEREVALVGELLDHADQWRRRVVHELQFGSGEHVRATSAYHCELPETLVAAADDGTRPDSARLLIPLTLRDKRPLLNFDLTGPCDSPHLLTREEIAVIQARYLGHLYPQDQEASGVADAFPPDLLAAICVFSPDVFRSFADLRASQLEALIAYLHGGLGFELTPEVAGACLHRAREAGAALARFLGEPPDPAFGVTSRESEPIYSSSECVLLALPKLEAKPTHAGAVWDVIDRYAEGVLTLEQMATANGGAAGRYLRTLAEYGRRWLMVLDLEVPLGAPFTVKVGDDRRLGLTRRTTVQRLPFREGHSVHVAVSTLDPTVHLAKDFAVTDTAGAPVGIGPSDAAATVIGPLELAHWTPEIVSLYSSEPERPERVDLRLRLRPAVDVVGPPTLALLLTVAAALGAVALPAGNDLVDGLAVLVVPTTFAATWALIREETRLATRLQRRNNVLLGAAVIALWVVALVRLLP